MRKSPVHDFCGASDLLRRKLRTLPHSKKKGSASTAVVFLPLTAPCAWRDIYRLIWSPPLTAAMRWHRDTMPAMCGTWGAAVIRGHYQISGYYR